VENLAQRTRYIRPGFVEDGGSYSFRTLLLCTDIHHEHENTRFQGVRFSLVEKTSSPATRGAGHGLVEGLLKAGGAEGAGLVRAASDDGAVRDRRLGLATGQVCIQRRPLLLKEMASIFCDGIITSR